MKIILSILFAIAAIHSNAQDFTLTLKAPQYQGGITYLTYYYGKNMNVEDSAAINEQGVAVFYKSARVDPGVYSIVFPGKRNSFDFLIDSSSNIQIDVPDTASLVFTTQVSGSEANNIFRKYQLFIAQKGPLLEAERQAFMKSKTKKDSVTHESNYKKINEELAAYRESIISEHPQSMLTALLKSMKEPPVLYPNPKTRQDSMENYQYYKKHYWDGISFTDARIIRTPFFLPKVERFFRQVENQNPDSLIRDIDYYLLLSRTTPKMYQFILNWATDEYFQPKYMGQDKVFVHLFEKYHSKGISNWLNEKQLKQISDRAYMVMSNLVGDPAAPLIMTNTEGREAPLYNLKAEFTVVCFWDPTCGHCRQELPVLDSIYNAKWKKEGVRIYAVLTDNSVKDKWHEFINEHKLGDWTNVYESEEQSKAVESANRASFRQLYDVIQTPTIYLLDKDKRIIAKKLTFDQLDDVISAKLNNRVKN